MSALSSRVQRSRLSLHRLVPIKTLLSVSVAAVRGESGYLLLGSKAVDLNGGS